MEDHEQEERELTSGFERSLATAIATTAALVEAYQRRRARQSPLDPVVEQEILEAADEQHQVQEDARNELAAGRLDGDLWRSAPYEMLNDQALRENGIDPRRIGEPEADKEWITRTPGNEILEVHESANRWSGRSEVALLVRENIAEELSTYGLDINDLLQQPRAAAAEQIETARAAHWAERGHGSEGTAAERAEAERDGQHVENLLEQANAADRLSGESSFDPSEQGEALARPTGIVIEGAVSRSEQAAEHGGHGGAGRAAAMAATDHPTQPRDAVAAAGKKRPKVKRSQAQPNRERGHSGR